MDADENKVIKATAHFKKVSRILIRIPTVPPQRERGELGHSSHAVGIQPLKPLLEQ